MQTLSGRNGVSSRRGNGFVNRSSGFRNGNSSRSGNFGNTRFGRNDSSRRNAFGNHSINYGPNQRRFGNRGINYDRNRGRNNARFGRYGRGFSRFGFGRRPYRSIGYGGFGRSRFRLGPVYYGHHYYRPWYPYYRRGINLSFGFGFYGGCYSFPSAYYYPSYYPTYVAPAYVGETVVYADYDNYDDDTVVVIENDDPDVLVLDGTSSQAAPRPTQNALPPNYDPNNPMILKINEGAEKFGQGQYPEAVRLFEEVALQDRQNADAWFALATASFATSDYRRSASAIREGIQVLPDMVNNVFDIRDRYGNMDDFQRHIETLERHVEANQNDVDAHIVLGFVYHFTGQRQWANEVFKYVDTISPNDQHLTRVFLNAKEIPANSDANTPPQPPVRTNTPTPIVTRTPPQPQPQPVTIRVFEGSVSDDGRVAPKRLSTIDGIVVEFDDVDDDPLEADFDVFVGATKYEFDHVRLGSRVYLRGLSGRRYTLSPIAINKGSERVTFTIRPE